MKALFAYTYPEQTQFIAGDIGQSSGWVRIPNHPKRPARSTDVSTWWEDVTHERAAEIVAQGGTVKMQ